MVIAVFSGLPSGTVIHLSSASTSIASTSEKSKEILVAKRPRSDGQNGPRQQECCMVSAQKIWWCHCRPDCLAQNASLHVQKHNSKPSFLMAVVTALCVARWQPTRQVTLSYERANFRDDFLVYDHTTGKTLVLVLCKSSD